MKNHWLDKKKVIGTIRYTNMMMCEDDHELPAKFTIQSESAGSYRCSKKEIPGPGPYLTWLSEDTIEVGGKEYKLRYSPACSAVRGDYVFTTTDYVFPV